MVLPNLPTDNLYKFMALSGIALIISSGYFLQKNENKLHDDKNKISLEIEELLFQQKLENEKDSSISKLIKKITNELDKFNFNEDSILIEYDITKILERMYNPEYRDYYEFFNKYKNKVFPAFKMREQLYDLRRERDEIYEQIQLKTNLIRIKNQVLESDEQYVKKIRLISGILSFIGSMLSYYGFRLWYEKIQKYIDLKVKNESIEDKKGA